MKQEAYEQQVKWEVLALPESHSLAFQMVYGCGKGRHHGIQL